MMNELLERIKNVEKLISKYYEMSFENEKDDYNFNKSIKESLKQMILESGSQNDRVKEQALLVFAQSSGCAEDQEIAEEIIDDLFDNKLINNRQLDYFYENLGTKRWE